ncbi:unnamed protein product [Lepidochelys kempii]
METSLDKKRFTCSDESQVPGLLTGRQCLVWVGSGRTYCWGLRKGLKFVLAESERPRGKAWLTAGKASHALRPKVNVMQPPAEGICLTVQEMDHSHRKNGLHLPGKVSTSRMLTWDENFRSSSHSIQGWRWDLSRNR